MLSAFVLRPQGLVRTEAPFASDESAAQEALWLDLLEPTAEEEKAVERALGIDVPTREEMREIEASNRLYEENGALFLTATIVTKLDTDLPESTQVTFILASGKLVTNRYTDPLPFRRFISYAQTHPAACQSAVLILVGLLESIVNRIADVLERVGSDLDSISAEVFTPPRRARRRHSGDFRDVLGRVGQMRRAGLESAREPGQPRAPAGVRAADHEWPGHAGCAHALSHVSRDVLAMSDHASFLGDKVSFALDATLGMVTIDQNNILKIFSVVTVFLLPPSVVGAFYGMNFECCRGPHEPWGAWAAVGFMAVSALLPYLLFKRRRWL